MTDSLPVEMLSSWTEFEAEKAVSRLSSVYILSKISSSRKDIVNLGVPLELTP